MLLALLVTFAATPGCTIPPLSLDGSDSSFTQRFADGSKELTDVKANFVSAYEHACAKGLLKTELPAIVLLNAPNANVASIYSDDRHRRVLEYPFVTEDGQANVPPVEEIEEAIYCAAHGATEAEQEESGRCLPD